LKELNHVDSIGPIIGYKPVHIFNWEQVWKKYMAAIAVIDAQEKQKKKISKFLALPIQGVLF
jgi:hypothetical protein